MAIFELGFPFEVSTVGWCPENFVIISLTVQEFCIPSCWQISGQTDNQTNKVTNRHCWKHYHPGYAMLHGC